MILTKNTEYFKIIAIKFDCKTLYINIQFNKKKYVNFTKQNRPPLTYWDED